jgi:hydrophobic/amphiphilic exporter-1 (mainly G- bacteria), HAE1 family
MKLTELAIRRPAFMAMIFLGLAVFGIYSSSQMGEDLLPKMDWPMAFVSIAYPGAGPEEIETQVSQPVEETLSSVNGIKSLRTYASEGFCFAWIEFEMSVNVDVAISDIERKMNQLEPTLPDGCKPASIGKADVGAFAILRIAALSKMEPMQFYQFVKDHVKPRIEQVDGVSAVEIVGGKQREIRVEVDNARLKHYGLSIQQVQQALAAANLDFPTGSVEAHDQKLTVRLAGKFHTVGEIRDLVLVDEVATKVYLRDVAQVLDTSKEDFTYGRLNGESTIGIIIQKASDANAVRTSELVRKALIKMEHEFQQKNLKFIVAQDITQFTKDAVHSVRVDMLLAILLVALVLFVFLHDIRSSFIVLLSIPTSLLTAFIMMKALDFSINLITMMAMTVVIGILVDDSIVVLENIHRKLEKGKSKTDAAIEGRSEIGLAAIAITLVDVVVFLPIAMLSGIVGKIFREFGLTIVAATLVSLFVSFTLTPLLASRWSKVVEFSRENFIVRFFRWFDRMEESVRIGYRGLLESSLRHRWRVVLTSIGALIASFVLVGVGAVGGEFMPSTDRGEFAINLEFAKGTGIAQNDSITKQVEAIVKNTKEIERYYTVVGRKEEPWGGSNRPDISQINVSLISLNKRKPTNDVMNDLLAKISKLPGVKPSMATIGLFGAAEDKPLQIEIKGDNLESLIAASEVVRNISLTTPGTRDVTSSWEEGSPEMVAHIDREKCARHLLTVGEVASVMNLALQGDTSTKYHEGDTDYDINVILDKRFRQDSDNLGSIIIPNHMGQPVQLSEVADISAGIGPNVITRKDRSRVISVAFNNTLPANGIRTNIEKALKKEKLPPDVNVFFAGDFEQSADMFSDMLMAIAFAVLFVYMIMVSLFESYIYPFIIMFSIPVALVGSLFALAITHQTLNIFSMIGILMSMGLVSKNAILLVDYTNTLRNRGMALIPALLEAGPTRLRPIVMTTLTMVFGMLPVAMSAGSGADMRKGLAIVVIGALISSTLLTLVLVPTVYLIVERIREFFAGKKEETAVNAE